MSELEIREVLRDPSAFFSEPKDVVAAPQLSREDKLTILRRWEYDALRLCESESEGMGGGEESMLGRVANAIQAVEALP